MFLDDLNAMQMYGANTVQSVGLFNSLLQRRFNFSYIKKNAVFIKLDDL